MTSAHSFNMRSRCPRASTLGLLSLLLVLVLWHASARQFPADTSIDEHLATFERLKGSVTTSYFSNDELEAFMLGMAQNCADMMSVFEFGRAGSGRRLLALDVSSSAGERCAACAAIWHELAAVGHTHSCAAHWQSSHVL